MRVNYSIRFIMPYDPSNESDTFYTNRIVNVVQAEIVNRIFCPENAGVIGVVYKNWATEDPKGGLKLAVIIAGLDEMDAERITYAVKDEMAAIAEEGGEYSMDGDITWDETNED